MCASLRVDLLDAVHPLHYSEAVRTVHRSGRWRIVVGAREHGEPHFHVWFSDGSDCAVSIARLKVLAGRVFPKDLQPALDWAGDHKAELMAVWEAMNP